MFRMLLVATIAFLVTAAAPNATVRTYTGLSFAECPAGIAVDTATTPVTPYCVTDVATERGIDLSTYGPYSFNSGRVALK